MAVTVNDPFHGIKSGTRRKVARAGFAAAHDDIVFCIYDDIVFALGTVRLNAQHPT